MRGTGRRKQNPSAMRTRVCEWEGQSGHQPGHEEGKGHTQTGRHHTKVFEGTTARQPAMGPPFLVFLCGGQTYAASEHYLWYKRPFSHNTPQQIHASQTRQTNGMRTHRYASTAATLGRPLPPHKPHQHQQTVSHNCSQTVRQPASQAARQTARQTNERRTVQICDGRTAGHSTNRQTDRQTDRQATHGGQKIQPSIHPATRRYRADSRRVGFSQRRMQTPLYLPVVCLSCMLRYDRSFPPHTRRPARPRPTRSLAPAEIR